MPARLRTTLVTLVVACSALALAGTASSAAPVKADKHDRALIKQLLRTTIDVPEEGEDTELLAAAQACPAWQADNLDTAVLLLFPGIFRMIDRMEPQFVAYQRRLAPMRPHAAAFKQWLAAKRVEMANMIRFLQGFDSARMDLCGFLEAAIAAGGDDAALEAALEKLFPDTADVDALIAFGEAEDRAEAGRKAANKKFAAFLKRSGYTKAQIALLTE